MSKLTIALVMAAVIAALVWYYAMQKAGSGDSSRPAIAPSDVDAFLAPVRSALDASVRPTRTIALEPLPDDAAEVSKVGGRAWWPLDEPPPIDEDGKRLVLLAQVNFAEMPPLSGYPDAGLLQIFIAPNDALYGSSMGSGSITMEQLSEQRRFRVIYWPDPERPASALPLADSKRTPHAPAQPRRMRFSTGEQPLSVDDHRFDRLFDGSAYGAAEDFAQSRGIDVDMLFDAVWERYNGSGHRLGGYPHFTQSDPRDDDDWELLLQLDSDDSMMWGDLGVANFFIRPDDLARRDFSRVAYNWDCH